MLVLKPNGKENPIGNPQDVLDPHKLYEEERNYHRARASGIGALVFEYIPFSLIKSFALAIDPLKKFRAAPVKITPVNRTRKRSVKSVLQPEVRRFEKIRHRTLRKSYQIPGNGLFCYLPAADESSTTLLGAWNVPGQAQIVTTTKDTTSRTRPIDSSLGEYYHFEYKLHSPPMSCSFRQYQMDRLTNTHSNPCLVGAGGDQYFCLDDTISFRSIGPLACMSAATLATMESDGKALLDAEMQKYVPQLLARVVPESRRYSAFRNVAELKDLPRSILSLKRAIENFSTSISLRSIPEQVKIRKYIHFSTKNVPGEYLSFHFGWKQIYKDVMDLLVAPVRAAKEVERLMRRSGLPTTFRTIRKYEMPVTNTPVWGYDNHFYIGHPGTESSHATEHKKKITLRLVVNATFDFPKVGVPEFKKALFLHKLGVNPMPTDLYNLIPWSWLVDWFTGLGNYVEAIDIINTDRSLFNWGLLTGIVEGEVTTTYKSKLNSTWSCNLDGVVTGRPSSSWWTHQSVMKYRLQQRKNITSAYGVKTILEPATLSPYQQSILAAILASRRRA